MHADKRNSCSQTSYSQENKFLKQPSSKNESKQREKCQREKRLANESHIDIRIKPTRVHHMVNKPDQLHFHFEHHNAPINTLHSAS